MVWKSGFSVLDAVNHSKTEYHVNRIALLRLSIVVLSQPLYYTPDEYILVLNPFSTFLTNRRTVNTKNLFCSLVNVIMSYDCQGYVSQLFLLNLTPFNREFHTCRVSIKTVTKRL